MADQIWGLHVGSGPLIATAIHDGHDVRDEVAAQLALPELERLREEDPFTGEWTQVAPTRVVGTRSRFETDLNRPRENAVYRVPEDAWGLQVWKGTLPDNVAERSLAEYDAFYRALGGLYGELANQFGAFVVYDLHTYNHRREGPGGPPADPAGNPQVNIGTGTMQNRDKFATLIERFKSDLAGYDFPGGKLDVRDRVLCGAIVHGDLVVSVRTERSGDNAAKLVQEVLDGIGSGGGHMHRAGGKVADVGGMIGREFTDNLRQRWLAACAVGETDSTPLVSRNVT